jgi:uncharacterized RDD family membrane protein YckC
LAGQWWLGLQVVDAETFQPAGVGKMLVKYVLLDWLTTSLSVYYPVVGLYNLVDVIMALLSSTGGSLSDSICGTAVVKAV